MAKKSATAKAPRKSKAPEGETKAQKFARLANARVSKALKTVSLIGNLSGSGYEYSDDQIAKINKALRETIDTTMQRFNPAAAKKAASTFTV